ncbi:MAG: tyrosine-protein phosphatase [Ilumatobacteraceae bacterium]
MLAPRLEGTPNFRDLGGLMTVDGRVNRHSVLFRSSALAILLCAVAVTREAVIADFMETELVLDDILAYLQRRPAWAGIVLRLPPGTLDVVPNFMTDFLDDVERLYGGVSAWLTDHAGVTAESVARLEQHLVEPRN